MSISRTLTRLAPRIPSPSLASIKLSTLPQDTTHCVSSTHTSDTIKSRWRSPIKPQRHSSLHRAPSVLTPCLSGSKTPVQPINACLETQIGKRVEAYVDDVVIKFRHVESLIDDLRLTFDNLRTYDIKLNPEKCVFGVPAGKLLGFIVSNGGIEANPAKSELCHSWPSQQTSSKSKN